MTSSPGAGVVGAVRLRGARVVDARGTRAGRAGRAGRVDILIREGRIVAIDDARPAGSASPADAATVTDVELDGRWVSPGSDECAYPRLP